MGILLAVVMLVVYFSTRGPRQVSITREEIDFERDATVVIMREEQVISVNDYSKVFFSVSEGQNISQGTPVADIYASGTNEKLFTDLINTRQQIKDKQENDAVGSIMVPDILQKDTQIRNKMQEISEVVNGRNSADLVSLEGNLSELIDQKSKLLAQKARSTPTEEELEDLYDKEKELNDSLDEFKERKVAEGSGVISFNMDGMEEILSPERIDEITRKDLDDARKGFITDSVNPESGKKPLYRLVNNYRWVCLLNVEARNAISEIQEGTIFSMEFSAFKDRAYDGKVERVRELADDGSKLYAFSMTEDIGPLISVRHADVKLKHTFNGLCVPLEALYNENGKTIIKQVSGGKVQPIEVNVLIKDETKAIVESANTDITIKVGQVVQVN